MTIEFLGHACFLLIDASGTRVIIDPYESGAFGNALSYEGIGEEADIVLVTHEHADHNYVRGVRGSPEVCRSTRRVRGIQFRATSAFHDRADGRKRGTTAIFVFELDGIAVCHAGDLGDVLDEEQVDSIGDVDVLMVPVGGVYTIDAQEAWTVVEQLGPRTVIPMHYKTSRISLPLAPLESFTAGKTLVERPGTCAVELHAEDLGDRQRILVLEPRN